MLKVVTKRAPDAREMDDCMFAWTVAKHVKSNAIVYAKDGATAGIGAGQINRRDSARSEEHTSELQSLMRISYAVFCLKKKNKHTNLHHNDNITLDTKQIRTMTHQKTIQS